MAKKTPNPVDRHVGNRLRMRRLMLAMSQEKIGEALGLTFQQVQKYEKGANRIGASRLQQISQILQVPVSFFFEGAPNVNQAPWRARSPLADLRLGFPGDFRRTGFTKAFTRIKGPRLRRRIVDLVQEIAERVDRGAGRPAARVLPDT